MNRIQNWHFSSSQLPLPTVSNCSSLITDLCGAEPFTQFFFFFFFEKTGIAATLFSICYTLVFFLTFKPIKPISSYVYPNPRARGAATARLWALPWARTSAERAGSACHAPTTTHVASNRAATRLMGENSIFSDRLFKEFRKSQHFKAQAVTFPKDSCCYARERQCSNKFKLQRTPRCLAALPRTPRNLKISALSSRSALLCIKWTNVLWSQPYWLQTSQSLIGKQQQQHLPQKAPFV